MGILDDAIREHLDLKRRRGADPAEVEQAEREALGPVRRGPEPADEEQLEPNGQAEAVPEPAFEEDLGWDDPPPAEHDQRAPSEPEKPARPDEGGGFFDAETEAAPEPVDKEPEAAAAPARPVPAQPPPKERVAPDDQPITPDPGGHETAEFDVEQALEQEPAKESEDVLEETPEFLQDTPDHDRLWFEQKPPRDFDFDK